MSFISFQCIPEIDLDFPTTLSVPQMPALQYKHFYTMPKQCPTRWQNMMQPYLTKENHFLILWHDMWSTCDSITELEKTLSTLRNEEFFRPIIKFIDEQLLQRYKKQEFLFWNCWKAYKVFCKRNQSSIEPSLYLDDFVKYCVL